MSTYWLSRIVLAALCILSIKSTAQTLDGRIIDEEGNPVAGAIVSIQGTFLLSITDKEGNFSIKEDGDSITVTHISFEPAVISTKDRTDKIQLISKTYLTEEVTINASRADDKSAIAYNILRKEDLEKINDGKDFPYLLNSLPSVNVTSDAGAGVGYTGIRVRGSDATRVNVTINGIPINDSESQQVYWVDLPDIASSVENVQVQRGLGNSTSGAGAFGASVNILTNQLTSQPYATFSSSFGSFNTYKNTLMFGSGLISNLFAVEGRLSKITSDGYIDRATSDLKSYYINAGYYGKKNSLRFVTFSGIEKTYQAWYGVPDTLLEKNRTYNPAGEYYDASGYPLYYNNQTDNYQQDYYQLLFSQELNEKLILNTALHYTYGRGYYEEYKPDEPYEEYDLEAPDTTNTTSDIIRRKWLSNDFYGGNISVEYNAKQLKLQGGIAATWYDGDHYGHVIAAEKLSLLSYPHLYYSDNATKTDVSVFLKTVYSVNAKTDITIDLQNRWIAYNYIEFNDDIGDSYIGLESSNKFFNPKIGVHYFLSPAMQIYLYGGIGHKEPVRDDYLNRTRIEFPSPEMMVDIESGIKGRSKKCTYGLNLYFMDYDNQLILTGEINDEGEAVRQNVKESYRAGVEAEAEYRFSGYYLKGNVTYSVNRIKRYFEYLYNWDDGTVQLNEYSNTPISFSPSLLGYASLGRNFTKSFSVEISGKYVGMQYLDNTGNELRSIDPYFISNLRLAYTISPKKIKEITLQLSVFNLLNTEYESNGYTYSGVMGGIRHDYNHYFPQAGTSFSAGVLIKL